MALHFKDKAPSPVIDSDALRIAWVKNRQGWPHKYYYEDEEGNSEDEDNKVLPLEDLLLGPTLLKISYEYWEHLARQYLRNPNLHTPSIAHAIAAKLFGVSESEIIECFAFYWRVVLATWKFENEFAKTCFEANFPSYNTFEQLKNSPHLPIRYYPPSALCDGNFYRFGSTNIDNYQFVHNPYTEPANFRTWHSGVSHLTLDCCAGIPTQLVPSTLGEKHQLQYIADYSAACEPCQDAEDYRVALFTVYKGEGIHHPRYHPLFYHYPSRDKRTATIRLENATFLNNEDSWGRYEGDIERIETWQAPYFFEYRPTKKEIVSTLLGANTSSVAPCEENA